MIHASRLVSPTARTHLRCCGSESICLLAACSGMSLRLDVISRTGIFPTRRYWRGRTSVAGRRTICCVLPMRPGRVGRHGLRSTARLGETCRR